MLKKGDSVQNKNIEGLRWKSRGMLRPFQGSALAPPQIPSANRHTTVLPYSLLSSGYLRPKVLLLHISQCQQYMHVHYIDMYKLS